MILDSIFLFLQFHWKKIIRLKLNHQNTVLFQYVNFIKKNIYVLISACVNEEY